jgi:structural maintenance of chromosome 1
MAVVMENHFDSIVVDNMETVKKCIDYLKEQKWHPMTFLPLDSIIARAPDQRFAY